MHVLFHSQEIPSFSIIFLFVVRFAHSIYIFPTMYNTTLHFSQPCIICTLWS